MDSPCTNSASNVRSLTRIGRAVLILFFAVGIAPLFAADATPPKTRVLIVVGPSNHPPGSHEVAAGGRVMQYSLGHMANVPDVVAELVNEWPRDEATLDAANTVVFIGDNF